MEICRKARDKKYVRSLSSMETSTFATKLEFFKFLTKQIINFDKAGGLPQEVDKLTSLLGPFIDQLNIKRIHERRLEVLERMIKAFSFQL